MRFVNDKIPDKKYIISEGVWGRHTVRQWQGGPGQTLELTSEQLQNFLVTLKRNGWYEQSAKR